MRFKTIISIVVISVIVLLMTTSCSRHRACHEPVVIQKSGPPTHAPAHGYRYKHRAKGVELVYDSGCGVYVVVGLPDHYYCDGHFFRIKGAHWEMSLSASYGWERVYEDSIPPGLRNKGKSKGKWKKTSYSRSG